MNTENFMSWAFLGQFLMSSITLLQVWMAGNKNPNAWLLSIFSQFCWTLFIVTTKQWGLLFMNAGLWYISVRNYIRWKKEASA